jgi:quercetin dioxygenase-like cupin family protein
VQFLVVTADASTGECQTRLVPDAGQGASRLIDAFRIDGPLAPVTEATSVWRDPAEFGVHVRPGQASWSVFRQAPGEHHALHHTDTIDLDTVLAGSVRLTAGGVDTELHAGDCVLLAGVPHSWLAGDDGCVLSVVFLGAARVQR